MYELTKEELLEIIGLYKGTDHICPHCYHTMTKDLEDEWYCPNEMCLYGC